jgi:hypothetical protein
MKYENQKTVYTCRSIRVVLSDAGSIPAASTIEDDSLFVLHTELFLNASARI